LLGGVSLSLDMKKCPPALLLALLSDKYDASLCAANLTHVGYWTYSRGIKG
jgi:hypothetical protein